MSHTGTSDHRKGGRGTGEARRRRRMQPMLTVLEVRRLLSTFTVDSTLDDGSVGTLRWAVGQANTTGGANTITFAGAVFNTPQTITLTGGPLELSGTTRTETIMGPAAGLTISGGGSSRVFQVDSGVTAILIGLTVSDGSTPGDGGGVYDAGGAVTLTNCTISGNSAFNGGGLYNLGGLAAISNCTFIGNSASGSGGGLASIDGTTSLTNCTFIGNSAFNAGGALSNDAPGMTTLTDCTVSGNSAGTEGGGLANSSGGILAPGDTIVAGNTGTAGPDASGTMLSLGHNLIGAADFSTGWVASDLTGTSAQPLNPLLAPLGSYGGPTQTMALLPGSPAIGKGITGDYSDTSTPITTDQRGGPRGSVVDIGAFQTSLVVESASGSVDTTATNLTLPGAVSLANQFAGSTITFDPAVFATPQTITLAAPLELSNTALTTSINGPAAALLVSGGGKNRVFQVDSSVTASLSGLTLTDGSAGAAGGLYNLGTATLTDCTISGNSAGAGGGLYNLGTATLTDCTISGNRGTKGGGLYNAPGGMTTLTNCTISGNSASQNGGGLSTGSDATTLLTNVTVSGNSATNGGGLSTSSDGTTTLTNVTVSGNSASGNGGGLFNAGGTVTIANTIVAANTAATSGPDAFGTFSSLGHNLIGETGGSSGWLGSDLTSSSARPLNPLLAPLGNYGGPTATMALLAGSPALDAGSDSIADLSIPTTDQRGALRGPAGLNAGIAVDIGAYEASSSYLVTSAADSKNVGALRTAVGWANVSTNSNPANLASPAANTIVFDTEGAFATPQTITLSPSLGTLELSNTSTAETITGPAAGVTVSGGNAVRVFQVDGGVTATLSGLTISGGSTSGNGGGLYNYGGTTSLSGVTVAGNSAKNGGGLFNSNRGTTTIINCSISGNSATAGGGGLYNYGGTTSLSGVTVAGNSAKKGGGLINSNRGTTTIINCSISGNSATAGGGGLYNAATASLNACTIAGNSAAVGGGIDNAAGGTATLEDTIVAANIGTGGSPSDIGGDNAAGVVGTYDLVGTGGAGGIAGGAGDIVLSNLDNLGLAPLGNYGGPTQTMPLLPGSVAIGTGNAITGVSNDQRGVPLGASPDIGAFQSQGFILSVVAGGTPQDATTGTAFTNPLAVTVTAIDPIEPVAGGIVYFSVNPAHNGASASLTAATAIITSNGIAQVTATANSIFGSYTVDASAIGAAAPASFGLKNLVALAYSGIVSQSIPWGTASVTFSGTLAGVQIPQGQTVAVTLDGVTQEAAIGSSGAFSITFDTAGVVISPTPYTVSYVYSSDGTFASVSTTSSLTITMATPTITWTNQADITYGTALSATQLDATASVSGNFTYTPAAGTILDAGTGQTLSVTFTPADSTHYNTAYGSVTINVDKATPTMAWLNPADITYGTALSATQLDATTSVPGAFAYTPAAGAVQNAGTGQTLSVTFTPTDTTDYNGVSHSVTINVDKATPIITWADPSDIPYGTSLSATQLDATSSWTVAGVEGSVPGTLTYTPGAGMVLSVGTAQTLSVAFAPSDSADYNPTSATATVTVVPSADLSITQFTAAVKTVQIGDSLTYTIDVINNGPSPATAVTITSPLGTGATYVTGSVTAAAAGTVNLQGSSVVASLGMLAVGDSASVTFTVIPSLIATLTGSARVTANEIDTNTSNNSATVSTTVVDRVGIIELSAAGYAVPDNAGSATITVSRLNGARGNVTVDYKTVSINALPGLDYTPVSGMLTFPNGVTSETIVVPVLDNKYDDHDELVSVVLSNVQTTETLGKPILGSPSTATLTIRDIDPDFKPLIVSGVQWTGTAQSITQILVTFSKPLIAATAINPANYALVNVGPDGKYGTLGNQGVAMSVTMYQQSDFVIALTPSQPLPADRFFHLSINSATSGGVEDVGDNMLAGDGSTAGTSYTAMLGRGTSLNYYTPAGDVVSLRITSGGIIDDLLSGSGQGIDLSVVGEVPHHTVLSGTIRKARGGTGQAYLGYTIWGLGSFGDVRVKLASPPFQISQYPFSPGSAASTAASPLLALPAVAPKSSSSHSLVRKPAHRGISTIVARSMNRPFLAFRH